MVNELYLPQEPSNIQLAPKPQYGDRHSPSSGNLFVCTPDDMLDVCLSRDQAHVYYLSVKQPISFANWMTRQIRIRKFGMS